jgi:diacylglycerol O-acyltransferase
VVDPATAPGGALTYDSLLRVVSSRLHLVPRFRQRVVFPPFGAGRPVWVDDSGFDISFHIRKAALPAPGGRRDLTEFVQRILSRPLDRTKPLWESYVIEGMEDGLSAILTKVHHAMIDGIAGMDIATAVFDFSPEPQILSPPAWRPEPEPGRFDLFVEAVRDQVLHPATGLADLAQRAWAAPARVAKEAATVLSGIGEVVGGGLAPPSPFNRPIGPNRRFAMADAQVQTFREIKRSLKGTVNDAVLATVAGALYRLLRERGESTRGRTLRAMVPVSVRTRDQRHALGNRVASIFVDLPVGPMGARRRLDIIRRSTKNLKESNQAVGAEFLMNMGMWAPPTLHAMAARLAARSRLINLVVSNVPGPQVPLYVAGARLLAHYPTMPLAETMGLSVAVTSLAGTMAFGVTADWDTLPDIEVLARGLEDSLAELQKAAGT